MNNTGFFYGSGVPDALIRAARKMSTAMKSGMGAEALRTTLELCSAEMAGAASSIYALEPMSWHSTDYGDALTTFGMYPFVLPDLSPLFRMEFLSAFKPEELALQKLLPIFFVTLPFLKRVTACTVWMRKHPKYRAILLTWLMALWGYDCCSARKDAERNKILSIARYDSLRTILKFVRTVRRDCQDEADVRETYEQFVKEEESARRYPDELSVEEFCRNEDWAYAGVYDRLIPARGPNRITKLMDELARKGSGPFAAMVRNGECCRMDFGIGQMFLYLVARSVKYDNLRNKTLKCVKALVGCYPEVLKARDASGDDALWQLFYSAEKVPLCHLRSLARYLKHKGCDPDRKSSVGISYNEVVSCAEALMEGPIARNNGRWGI